MAEIHEGKLESPPEKKSKFDYASEKNEAIDGRNLDKNSTEGFEVSNRTGVISTDGCQASNEVGRECSDGKCSADTLLEGYSPQGSILFLEKHFGIEEYVSKEKGTSGILKQRYSDFMVREVEKNGNCVQLQNLEYVEEMEDTNKKSVSENKVSHCPMSSEDLEKIETFCTKKTHEENAKDPFVLLRAGNDKEHRKLVHLFIKESYKDLGMLQNL